MLTREEASLLFRSLFDRLPDEASLDLYCSMYGSFSEMRAGLMRTEEYYYNLREFICDYRQSYIACDYPPRNYDRSRRKKTLALACIVKNEADNIGKMIASCLPLVDYIAILDTGSIDDTIAVCQAAIPSGMGRIEPSEFVNFGAARNQALDMVAGLTDWVLMLDADEYLVSHDYAYFADMIEGDYGVDGWRLPRYNFLDELHIEKPLSYPDYQKRLFHNRPDIRYYGKVHEWVGGVRKWGFSPISEIAFGGTSGGPHIHHVGHFTALEKRMAKHALYETLAAS